MALTAAAALCIPLLTGTPGDAGATPNADTESIGEDPAAHADSLAALLERLDLPVEERIDLLLDRFIRLEAVARDEAAGIDAVVLIEARALADEVEELAAWGESELAVEMAVEAIRTLEAAGVRLPSTPAAWDGAPDEIPAGHQPIDGGTSGSRTGES